MKRKPIHWELKHKEAPSFGKSIVDYDRKSWGFRDYLELAAEILGEAIRKKQELGGVIKLYD